MSVPIFDRLMAGELVQMNDPEWVKIDEVVTRTLSLIPGLNSSTSVSETRTILTQILQTELDTVTVFVPFHINFGIHTKIGKNVFINHACSFLDLGGITIQDDVFIGPKVSLITENHPLDPRNRRALVCGPILIKRNAWIGANVTILPGVTVGENSVIAAGAVVSKDVPDNVVFGGVPAKFLKDIEV